MSLDHETRAVNRRSRGRRAARSEAGRGGFPPRVLALLLESRMFGVRAGTGDHKFTGVWFVLVGGRLFVRPWSDSPGGWREAFASDPRGTIRIGEREIPVRARTSRGERLFDAVDAAYAAKYDTKASLKWVRGFARPRRRKTTTELVPR